MENKNENTNFSLTTDHNLPDSRPVSIKTDFSFENLRVDRPLILTRKIKHTLSVRRPKGREEFFRIQKGDERKFPTCIYKSKLGKSEADNTYMVHPDFWEEFAGKGLLKFSTIYMGIIWDSDEIFLSDIPEPNLYLFNAFPVAFAIKFGGII